MLRELRGSGAGETSKAELRVNLDGQGEAD
jgi:hypothetical protein